LTLDGFPTGNRPHKNSCASRPRSTKPRDRKQIDRKRVNTSHQHREHVRAPATLVNLADSLPSAPEAESALLSMVFSDGLMGSESSPSLTYAIGEGIGPKHFQNDSHRKIFQAQKALLLSKLPVETVAVWQQLETEFGSLDTELRTAVVKLSAAQVSSLHVKGVVEALLKAEAKRQQVRATINLLEALKTDDEDLQREARGSILDAGQGDRAGLPKIVSATDLVAKACPSPAVLVAGVLHRGAKAIIGGGSKSYKSWVLIDLALSVAAGAPFWGLSTSNGRVLYLNAEIPEPFFRGRMMAVAEAKALAPDLYGKNLDVWTLRGHAVDISRLAPHVLTQSAGRDYALIIVDPIYKLLGDRDENSAGDVADLLNQVERLAVKTGAAVVIAHHFAKGSASGKDSKDRVSGSGVWARDPDALLTLTPHETDSAFAIDFTLRNFSPRSPFVVRWEWPLMRLAADLDPGQLRQQPGRPKEHTIDSLMGLVPELGATYTELKSAAERSGMSDYTLKKLLRDACSEGRLQKGYGKYCRPIDRDEGGGLR
jgi:hypothetical protein